MAGKGRTNHPRTNRAATAAGASCSEVHDTPVWQE
jgi:hypothetical protein